MEPKEQLKLILDKHLATRPDAFRWLMNFWHLCHATDDIIDIPERRADNEFIGHVLMRYVDVFSDDFYAQRRHKLYSLVRSVHHIYFDSIKWEFADQSKIEEWKKTYWDVMRCSTNQLLVAVVEIVVLEETGSYELSYEAGREVGIVAREAAYYDHHDEKGKPI